MSGHEKGARRRDFCGPWPPTFEWMNSKRILWHTVSTHLTQTRVWNQEATSQNKERMSKKREMLVSVLSLSSLVSESGVYALSQWAGFSLCWFPSLQSPGSQGAWAQELWCPRQVGSSWTRDLTGVPCTARQILNHGNTRKPNFLIFNWRRIITLGWFLQLFFVFNNTLGTSLEVQWLGLHLPVLGEAGVVVEVVVQAWSLVRELGSHVLCGQWQRHRTGGTL